MKNNNTLKHSYLAAIALLTILFLASCKKDEKSAPAPVVVNGNIAIDVWMEKQMRLWYLWADSIPSKRDTTLDPKSFFSSLLYKRFDKLSFIVENYTDQIGAVVVTKEAGYTAYFYVPSGTNKVNGLVTLVKPNSPASNVGLKRGDLIQRINGQQLTSSNFYNLVPQTNSDHTLFYIPQNATTKTQSTPVTVSITLATNYIEDPNYLATVLGIGDHKVGYYVNNFLSEGTSKEYSNEMDNIFGTFKNSGITDLVIDLRYNNFGDDAATTNLASLIAPTSTNDIFYSDSINLAAKAALIADSGYKDNFEINNFVDKSSSNVSGQLLGNTVYILTSPRTASAAELLINGLKPYMNVYLIGGITAGQNYINGGFYEVSNPNNKWGIFPVVSKPLNSEGKNKYSAGFLPDTLLAEFNGSSTFIYPLGDTSEVLLNAAITKILNGGGIAATRLAASDENMRKSNDLYSPSVRPSILTLGREKAQRLSEFKKKQ